MASLIETITDKERMQKPFFNVEFPPEQVAGADKVEVWGSDFSEPGSDYCEYRLIQGGSVIASQRISGY